MKTLHRDEKASGMEGSRLGPYLVGARLGIGGAAAVYLGVRSPEQPEQDHPPEDVVALKVIHEHLAVENEFIHMFLDEARVAARLDHPNVIRTYELGQDGDRLFMAMEYLHGHSLHEVFVRGTRQGARLPVDLVAWIGARVARALHYAHTLTDSSGQSLHLIHRDVSPRNIFIAYDGTVKLIDFGIAHAVGRTAKTKVGQMKGTFSYIAPERALGGSCDHRADIFSLAAALFEAATGQRLFRGDDDVQTLRNVLSGKIPDPRSIRDGFPDEMTRILLKALALRPTARHASALQLAEDLDAFVASSGLEPPQARLALMMGTIFAEDRSRKDAAIEKVRSFCKDPDAPAWSDEPAQDASSVALSRSGPHTIRLTRRARWPIALVLAATTAAAWMFSPLRLEGPQRSPADAPTTNETASAAPTVPPSPPNKAVLDLSTAPAASATFSLGNQTVQGSVARFEVARGPAPLTVFVRAEGFAPTRIDLVPDQNRTVAVPLQPLQEPPAPTASAPSRPARTATRPSTRREPPTELAELLNKRH
jgi:serine/threonine-protein kinase